MSAQEESNRSHRKNPHNLQNEMKPQAFPVTDIVTYPNLRS